MKITFDMQALQSVNKIGGIGKFNFNYLSTIFQKYPENKYELIFNGPDKDKICDLLPKNKNAHAHIIPYLPGNDLNRWNLLIHHINYWFIKSDITHILSPFEDQEHTVIAKKNLPGKLIITIYDFIPFLFKDIYLQSPAALSRYLERSKILQFADAILSISEATREDAIRLFDIPPEKITNIGIAVSDDYYKMGDGQLNDLEKLKSKLGIQGNFILSVSNLDPRKNLLGLMKAFSKLPNHILNNYSLLIVTNSNQDYVRNNPEISMYLKENKYKIRMLYSTTNAELCALYNYCSLFIYASLYEGGGLPVVEAMKCGAPVISSNRSSIPEYLGRKDNLFNPEDVDEMTYAMEKVLTDYTFEQDLRAHGLNYSKEITWENVINKAVRVYQEVLSN